MSVAVVGSGPAGLMAAFVAAETGSRVRIFEKRRGPGRKLLVAGSSGLNITYDAPIEEFVRNYSVPGANPGRNPMHRLIEQFPPEAWRGFIESLGIGTFKGTSRRWFIEGMKAPALLKAWISALEARGAGLHYGKELIGVECGAAGSPVTLAFADGGREECDAAILALGGGSWEPGENPLRWPALLASRGVAMREFAASNVGFRVAWPPQLVREAEGKPIKNVVLSSPRGSRAGDLVITAYGIEGTPVYFAGQTGKVRLDLKPDLDVAQVERKLSATRENLSPARRVRKLLNLSEGADALVFHLTPWKELGTDLRALARRIKEFPLELEGPRPLDEAISSSGGVEWGEVDERLMLRKCPGVFLAGEMLDWDAPTGGFLLQGCAASGRAAGLGAIAYLRR